MVEFLKKLGIDSGRCKLIPPKAQLSGGNLNFWWSDVSRPFHLTFFMILIWIRLTISVSIQSREINGRGISWQNSGHYRLKGVTTATAWLHGVQISLSQCSRANNIACGSYSLSKAIPVLTDEFNQ
jgi:hypothetical protein